MYLALKQPKRWLLILLLPFLILSCSEIRLIGAYDQTIDQGIQKISKSISTLLIKLQKNIQNNKTADNAFNKFDETYTDIESDLKTLIVRAAALPKYGKVKTQIDLVSANVQNLQTLHKSGFSVPGKNPTDVIKTVSDLFDISFTAMIAAQEGLKREKTTKP